MRQIIIALFILVTFGSCTKDFVKTNENSAQISDVMLLEDNNLVGAPISNLIFNLNGHQIEEDLCYDSWMGVMGTPTDFVGNVNNTTYYIRWNSYWGRIYGSVMSPGKLVIERAQQYKLPMFGAWAKLIRIIGISKLSAIHGPVIYSNYGSSANSILYDKESDLYPLLFRQLDSIQTDFAANSKYAGFAKFDPTNYKGNVGNWMKVVNSVRLRLAMRISKVDKATAKTQGEKALSDPAGLIEANADNFTNNLLGNIMPVAQICYQWDDTRMGAVIESFMVGFNDGRLSKYFAPASASVVADHPTIPYKGIRNGAYIKAKADHLPFSKVSNDFNSATTRRNLTAAEVLFLKAEAGLRGWTGAGDPKTNYENGIKASFTDWGGSGADAYVADATSKPINYVDPIDVRNNFTTPSTITIAWNNADPIETKLEKIITQKYLASYTQTLEAWVDFRRTGYPKIPPVAKNDSSPDWGIIAPGQWIKRMPFVNGERTSNTAAVTDATTKIGAGAKDDIATRLWWDTGAVTNF